MNIDELSFPSTSLLWHPLHDDYFYHHAKKMHAKMVLIVLIKRFLKVSVDLCLKGLKRDRLSS